MFATDKSGLDSLSSHLASLYRLNPQTNVNIRADRTTQYEFVEPALRAVSIAARSVSSELPAAVNPRVNLMVVKD
jgi:biopolymer transport protein ExbD